VQQGTANFMHAQSATMTVSLNVDPTPPPLQHTRMSQHTGQIRIAKRPQGHTVQQITHRGRVMRIGTGPHLDGQ
jgi:hypothetical protein